MRRLRNFENTMRRLFTLSILRLFTYSRSQAQRKYFPNVVNDLKYHNNRAYVIII